MQLKVFYISQLDSGTAQDEMNKFLRVHKVIRVVDKEHIDSEGFVMWSFRVWYVEGEKMLSTEDATRQMMRDNYKESVAQMTERLTAEQKETFEKLRKCRQQIAEVDVIKQNFNIFSDKELLIIAAMEDINEQAITEHADIKKDRKEKYARRLVEQLKVEN
jgi:hypothetical protein